jgi:hypothetical protein
MRLHPTRPVFHPETLRIGAVRSAHVAEWHPLELALASLVVAIVCLIVGGGIWATSWNASGESGWGAPPDSMSGKGVAR